MVFADVSQTPKINKIQGQIADSLGLQFSEASEPGRAWRLCEGLRKEKKNLIILDDIRGRLDLETVGIPFRDDYKGCKTLLISGFLNFHEIWYWFGSIPWHQYNGSTR